MNAIYETEKLVSEYLLFHYGTAADILPWEQGPASALGFPARIASRFSDGEVERSLDLGCAVGRSSFELSRSSREVVGIDYSQAFIDAADGIKGTGAARISRLEEASLESQVEVRLPDGVCPGRVSFEQGDAMDLRGDLGTFDRVLAANLLCRLREPAKLLARLPELVKPGGELVLTTPCTWLEEFTPPGNWPGDGTFEWLKNALSGDFELLAKHDEPFLIRETARKFQWTVAMLTRWRRPT
jgi:putative 4-mercaptohistidine N1-methyltranferase